MKLISGYFLRTRIFLILFWPFHVLWGFLNIYILSTYHASGIYFNTIDPTLTLVLLYRENILQECLHDRIMTSHHIKLILCYLWCKMRFCRYLNYMGINYTILTF